MNETTAFHLANIIKKSYSPRYLELVAIKMGEQIAPGEDIFQALIRVGRTHDLESAVTLVARQLDVDDSETEIPRFLRKDAESDKL
jgi:hypothetical protein